MQNSEDILYIYIDLFFGRANENHPQYSGDPSHWYATRLTARHVTLGPPPHNSSRHQTWLGRSNEVAEVHAR